MMIDPTPDTEVSLSLDNQRTVLMAWVLLPPLASSRPDSC